MNAMTLLRAMSMIDPEDMEAAYAAGEGMGSAVLPPESRTAEAEPAGIPVPYPKPVSAGKRYAIGGWAAAAACLALVAAAGLYFRSNDDYMTMHSGSEQVTEIIGTSPAETVLTQTTERSTGPEQTGTTVIETAAVTAVTEMQDSLLPGETAPALPETDTGIQQTAAAADIAAATTTAAPSEAVIPAEIPALIAVSDGSGSLTRPDGSAFAPEESVFVIISDAEKIRDFLGRQDPAVALGTGRKPETDSSAILADPVLLDIRWQMQDDRWTSYGIRSAELTADGVLHLTVVMYSSEEAEHPEPWIYETALLCRSGDVPAVTGTELTLVYYTDTEETGIRNYLRFTDSISDDIYIHVDGS